MRRRSLSIPHNAIQNTKPVCASYCTQYDDEHERKQNQKQRSNKHIHSQTPLRFLLSVFVCLSPILSSFIWFRSYAFRAVSAHLSRFSCKHVRRKWITDSDHFWTASSEHWTLHCCTITRHTRYKQLFQQNNHKKIFNW